MYNNIIMEALIFGGLGLLGNSVNENKSKKKPIKKKS